MALPQDIVLGQSTATWQELIGAKNWEGLVDPLNDDLRRLILRCGDLCQVTYDTFIDDQNSEYCGCSRYGKADLLKKTAFPGGADHYDVVGFLYATARVTVPEAFMLKSMSHEQWDRESNWIGYVAVSNDSYSKEMGRREIYVAWRGTIRKYEWICDFQAVFHSAKELLRKVHPMDGGRASFGEVSVMQGWLTMYTSEDPKSPFTKLSARTQLLTKLTSLLDKYKDEDLSIIISGHSLGGALAILSAFDVAENLTNEIPIAAFTFEAPQVGNKAFKDRSDSHTNLKVFQVRNTIDLIPRFPSGLFGYVDMGTLLEVDTRKSSYLKPSRDPMDWHNLQAVLHVVNGWQGQHNDFAPKIKRSIALVNKSCGFLKDECLVPEAWWVAQNKGMQMNKVGDWVLAPPEVKPTPEFE